MKQKKQEKLLTWLCEWKYKNTIRQFLKTVDPASLNEKNIPHLLQMLTEQFPVNRLFSKVTFEIIAERKIRERIREKKSHDVISLFLDTEKPRITLEALQAKFPEYSAEELDYFLHHHDQIQEILNKPLLQNAFEKEKVLKYYWNNIKKLIDDAHHLHLFHSYSILKENKVPDEEILKELQEAYPEIEKCASKMVLDFEIELKKSNPQAYTYYLLKKRNHPKDNIETEMKKEFIGISKEDLEVMEKIVEIKVKKLIFNIIKKCRAEKIDDEELMLSLYFEFPNLTQVELEDYLSEVRSNHRHEEE